MALRALQWHINGELSPRSADTQKLRSKEEPQPPSEERILSLLFPFVALLFIQINQAIHSPTYNTSREDDGRRFY